MQRARRMHRDYPCRDVQTHGLSLRTLGSVGRQGR